MTAVKPNDSGSGGRLGRPDASPSAARHVASDHRGVTLEHPIRQSNMDPSSQDISFKA